jgi:hypothetical protein
MADMEETGDVPEGMAVGDSRMNKQIPYLPRERGLCS